MATLSMKAVTSPPAESTPTKVSVCDPAAVVKVAVVRDTYPALLGANVPSSMLSR